MRAWFNRLREKLMSSFWFLPSVMACAAVALSYLFLYLDRSPLQEWLAKTSLIYAGGAEGARGVLSTIAGSVITVAGTTFSITVAALSLASGQFGPRLLRNFMRDTGNQVVLGTFTSTFLYCILVLRAVRGGDNTAFVPEISVTGGVVLAVISLGVLIYFIHHVSESIQVSHVLQAAAHELNHAFDKLFPERIGAGGSASEPVLTGTPAEVLAQGEGYIQDVDEAALMEQAEKGNLVIELLLRPGDFMIPGARLALVWPAVDEAGAGRIARSFTTGRARTTLQDAEFALLQVAEVGVRALSPGINDPFTAIVCVDRITAAMCRLAGRRLPDRARRDSKGAVRVVARPYEYSELVEAAYRHLREAAKGHWQVERRLRESLREVSSRAHDARFRRELEKESAALGSG